MLRRTFHVMAIAVLLLLVSTACAKSDPVSSSSPVTAVSNGAGNSPGNPPGNSPTPAPPADGETKKPGKLPGGSITLVALGDSLTEGSGDVEGEGGGYPARLGRALDQRGRSGSTVVNLGLSGWSSTQVLEGQDGQPAQLPKAIKAIGDAKAKGQPAVALLLIGSNDLWYLYGSQTRTTPEEEKQDLANYRANLDKIVSGLTGAGAAVVVGINDDQSKRPVATDAAKRREAVPDLEAAEVQMMSGQARRYAEVVRQVAANRGAFVADFLDAPLFANPATLADDGNHPNGKGYDEMTSIWLRALQPLLG